MIYIYIFENYIENIINYNKFKIQNIYEAYDTITVKKTHLIREI